MDGEDYSLDSTGAIELLIPARERDLGGFSVGRVLPFARRRMVGPFIFFDHLGPLLLPAPVPRSFDVRPHPHIGLSTVTYLFEGEITHRDSLGIEQVIRPGDVNWMTAGRGISHSERFDGMRERGGRLHALQAWVALPEAHEEDEPAFEHVGRGQLQEVELPGVCIRVIAGAAFGATSPVRTLSPLVYAHLQLDAGAVLELHAEQAERALYVVEGAVGIGSQEIPVRTMAVLVPGSRPLLQARTGSTVMLLGGSPIGERDVWWNFVSSRAARIEQARSDWSEGRIALPPADCEEFIPLPAGA